MGGGWAWLLSKDMWLKYCTTVDRYSSEIIAIINSS